MKRLVLVGAGHAHARVLRDLAMRRLEGVDVILVSPTGSAPYSGMVPGWMAGHYRWEECCIDFVGLCQRAGATLMLDTVLSVDAATSTLTLNVAGAISYDWLSLNIGSTLEPPSVTGRAVLPLRPLSALQARWEKLLESVHSLDARSPVEVAMVGGGAAGVESILAAHHRLNQIAPDVDFHFVLITQGKEFLSALPPGAIRQIRKELDTRNIRVIGDFSVIDIEAATGNSMRLNSRDGRSLNADVVLWATGAQAMRWPQAGGIATDPKGFVRVDEHLRSISHKNIFAVGDCARLEQDLPKSGVFSVRMGPVLSHNVVAAIKGGALKAYVPQRRYLMIIGSGDANATAVWGKLLIHGKWVWRWKQKIDRHFIATYNRSVDVPPPEAA